MKNKPSNLKYTDLCIYVDNTVYNRDDNNVPISLREMTLAEQEKVYNYIYNIIGALTTKKKLFPNFKYIEEFSIEAATNVFLRLTNPKQDFSTSDFKNASKKTLVPLKSVLNYIKKVLPFMVVDFRNEHYQVLGNPEYLGVDNTDGIIEYIEDYVRSDYEKPKTELLQEGFKNIIKHLNKVLDKGIFKNNEKEKNNLKMSILLTLKNIFTVPTYLNLSTRKKLNKIKSQVDNWKENIVV